jgi:hypothetical protein
VAYLLWSFSLPFVLSSLQHSEKDRALELLVKNLFSRRGFADMVNMPNETIHGDAALTREEVSHCVGRAMAMDYDSLCNVLDYRLEKFHRAIDANMGDVVLEVLWRAVQKALLTCDLSMSFVCN